MGMVLNTRRMRVVHTNDRGRVLKRRTFKRGDAVSEGDLEHIEGRFEALVASGALVDEEEFTENATSGFVDDTSLARGQEEDASHEDSGDTSGESYEDWDYDLLKEAVNERELEPASMKKKDLVAALRADDETKSDEG